MAIDEIDSILANNGPLIGETRLAATSLGARDHVNPATGKVQTSVLVGGGASACNGLLTLSGPMPGVWQ